jgi:hypothetical protein
MVELAAISRFRRAFFSSSSKPSWRITEADATQRDGNPVRAVRQLVGYLVERLLQHEETHDRISRRALCRKENAAGRRVVVAMALGWTDGLTHSLQTMRRSSPFG